MSMEAAEISNAEAKVIVLRHESEIEALERRLTAIESRHTEAEINALRKDLEAVMTLLEELESARIPVATPARPNPVMKQPEEVYHGGKWYHVVVKTAEGGKKGVCNEITDRGVYAVTCEQIVIEEQVSEKEGHAEDRE